MSKKGKGGKIAGHDQMRKDAAEFMETRRITIARDFIPPILKKNKTLDGERSIKKLLELFL